jgi:hypothetical protein
MRIRVTDEISQSPSHEQALEPRVFDLNRHKAAARVFYLKHHSIGQALAARVFNLKHYATEWTPAPKLVHLHRHNFAPSIFHLNHHAIGQSLLPDRFFGALREG